MTRNGKKMSTRETSDEGISLYGTSAQLSLNLQTWYDLEVAGEALGGRIELEFRPHCQELAAA